MMRFAGIIYIYLDDLITLLSFLYVKLRPAIKLCPLLRLIVLMSDFHR